MIIYFSTLLISLALAVSGSLTFWPIHHWYDFYIPIVLFVAGVVGMILLWILLILIFGLFVKKEYHSEQSKWARFWLEQGHDFLMIAANIKVKINGKEKLPTSQRFLLVGNHRSDYDSMVMTSKLKKYDLVFVTKESNYKIPFFGRLLYGACFYPVDRNDQLQSLETFKRCSELITSGKNSVAVFPEGKRQRDTIIGDFHEGVFNIALRAKCPIVVVTEDGGEAVRYRTPFRRTTITVDVLGVIPYDDMVGETAKSLSDKVHQIMYEHLERIDIQRHQRRYNKDKKHK